MRLLDYLDIHGYVAATYNGSSGRPHHCGRYRGTAGTHELDSRALGSNYTDPNFPQPNYSANSRHHELLCSSAGSAAHSDDASGLPPVKDRLRRARRFPSTNITSAEPSPSTARSRRPMFSASSANMVSTMGVFWPTSGYSTQVPGNMAFEIYRNYDGKTPSSEMQELSSTHGRSEQARRVCCVAHLRRRCHDRGHQQDLRLPRPTRSPSAISPARSTQAQVYPVQQRQSERHRRATQRPHHSTGLGQSRHWRIRMQPMTFPGQSITLVVIPSH